MFEKLIPHAKSAAITFASVFAVEIYVATANVTYLSELGGELGAGIMSAATLTAARAVLKFFVGSRLNESA